MWVILSLKKKCLEISSLLVQTNQCTFFILRNQRYIYLRFHLSSPSQTSLLRLPLNAHFSSTTSTPRASFIKGWGALSMEVIGFSHLASDLSSWWLENSTPHMHTAIPSILKFCPRIYQQVTGVCISASQAQDQHLRWWDSPFSFYPCRLWIWIF